MPASPPDQALLDWLQNRPTNLSPEPIGMETPLIDGGIIDSLGLLELVSFLEERFGLELPLDDFIPENFRTPAAILAMLDRLQAGSGTGPERENAREAA